MRYDSWLAIGLGGPTGAIASSGIDFTLWDATTPIEDLAGAVMYWRSSDRATLEGEGESGRASVLVAQLTLPTNGVFTVSLNAEGKSVSGDDWRQENIVFHINAPPPPAAPSAELSMESNCDFFSAIFSSTILLERSGRYRFFEASHTSASVFVDGQELQLDGCAMDSGVCVENIYSVFLQEGEHHVSVKFVAGTGGAFCHVWWQYVGSTCAYSVDTMESGDWVDADAIGSPVSGITDDGSVEVPIPFGFPFYGGVKTTARISANGYISFSGEQFSYGDTYAIPDEAPPNEMVAVFWTDLDPEAGGQIHLFTSPTMFVAMWQEVPVFETDLLCTFQVQLTSDGGITMLYRQMPGAGEHSYHVYTQPSIGIENIDGTKGLRIAYGESDVSRFGTENMKVEIPVGCEVETCSGLQWRMEVYDGTAGRGTRDAVLRSTHCTSFHSESGEESPFISRRDVVACLPENSACWCPPSVVPNSANPCAPFSVMLTKTLEINRAGVYRFVEDSNDQVEIFIDGSPLHKSGCIIDDSAQCTDEKTFEAELSFGVHEILLTVEHFGTSGVFTGDQLTSFPELSWEYAGSGGCDWNILPAENWHSWVEDANAVNILNGTTDTMAHVVLPFEAAGREPFQFYGGVHSSLNVYANGYVSFSRVGISTSTTASLPSPGPPNFLIAVYWTNFEMRRHGSVWTYTPPGAAYW